MYRRWLSFTLALVMLLTFLPANVYADDFTTIQETLPEENTGGISREVAFSEESVQITYVSPRLYASFNDSVSVEEAINQIRQAMVNREATITILFHSTNSDSDAVLQSIYDGLFEHTGNPVEGDYLRWHYSSFTPSGSITKKNSVYYYDLTFTFGYYTTAAQEAELDTAVSDLLESLDLDGKSDYEKFSAIYQYMCANIEYDYVNLKDDSYDLKYTAYAALINKTAVCQGYANLLYRLMLEVGIDCRLISGIGNGGGHGWNIVRMGDYYYNVDSTWDAGSLPQYYDYCLVTDANFGNHTRDAEYATAEFYAAYPMASSNYDYSSHIMTFYPATEATDTTDGNIAYWYCTHCNKYFLDDAASQEIEKDSWIIPATGTKTHLGDADGDGYIDAYDASLVVKYSVGTITAVELNLDALDLDGDGYVDAYDASLIQKYSVGAIERFPVESV